MGIGCWKGDTLTGDPGLEVTTDSIRISITVLPDLFIFLKETDKDKTHKKNIQEKKGT